MRKLANVDYEHEHVHTDPVAKTKRVQILMEPLEFAALERLAQSRGSSVAELIRDAARAQYLGAADRDRRARAAEFFLSLPDTPLPPWATLKQEIEDRRGSDLP
jgi:Ribbon-helix-helix protein, copG family